MYLTLGGGFSIELLPNGLYRLYDYAAGMGSTHSTYALAVIRAKAIAARYR